MIEVKLEGTKVTCFSGHQLVHDRWLKVHTLPMAAGRVSKDQVNCVSFNWSNFQQGNVVGRFLCTHDAGRGISGVVERRIVAMEELWTGNWDVGGWSMLRREKD